MYSPVMPSWEASVVELSPSICKISTIQTPGGTGNGQKFIQADFGSFLKQTLENSLLRADVRQAGVTFLSV